MSKRRKGNQTNIKSISTGKSLIENESNKAVNQNKVTENWAERIVRRIKNPYNLPPKEVGRIFGFLSGTFAGILWFFILNIIVTMGYNYIMQVASTAKEAPIGQIIVIAIMASSICTGIMLVFITPARLYRGLLVIFNRVPRRKNGVKGE